MNAYDRREIVSIIKDSRVLLIPGDIITLEGGEEVEIETVVMNKAQVLYYLSDGVTYLTNEAVRRLKGE